MQGATVLIYAAIADSRNAEELLTQTEPPDARSKLMERLAACVAEHHAQRVGRSPVACLGAGKMSF